MNFYFGLRNILVLITLLVPAWSFSQFYQLRNYNVSDGLPSSDVYNMLQDSKGYLWFAGDMGVSRYDGYEFKNFSTENGLPDNSIVILREDHKGRIWFLSYTGELSYYVNGVISTLPVNKKLMKQISQRMVTSMYVDRGDTIWLGIYSADIVKVLPGWRDLKVETLPFKEKGGYIYKIDNTGFVYGGRANKNDTLYIHVYTKAKKEYTHAFYSGSSSQKIKCSCLRLKNGSFLFSLNDWVFYFDHRGLIRSKKEDDFIITMFEDNDSILIGNYGGLRTYNRKTFTEKPRINALEKKSIGAILRDHENGLWFATEGQGIYYLPHINFQYYTPGDGLSESKITQAEVLNEKVALGHLNASVSILDTQSIHSIPIDPDRQITALNEIDGLIWKKDGKLLAGTRHAAYELDPEKTSRIKKIDLKSRKLIRGARGTIWAVRFGDIHEYDSTGKMIRSFLIKPYTDNMFEDSRGNIWVCSIEGLFFSNGASGLESLGEKNKLLSNRIVDLEETPDGTLWMVSRGAGIIIKKGNKFLHFTKKEGLAGNMCRTVFKDKENTIWVGTNNGLSRIGLTETDSFLVRNFSTAQGLLSNEVNHILELGNKLWLIHNNGITIFDPQKLAYNTTPPPVYINSILVNDSMIDPGKLQSLNYDQNHLAISFVALSFKAPSEIIYKYKLEGLDSYWNYTHQTSVKYQALPSGTYTFIVQGRNNDGFWSTAPAGLVFSIKSPWWQTLVFKIAACLFGLSVILIIFQKRIRAVKRREIARSIIQRQIETSELMALRARMNPHFIFNVINSVQHFITNNDAASSQKYLSKFAKLIRYVFDNSKPSPVPLHTELDALRLYLELEALRFENKFSFTITVSETINSAETFIPSMVIQPYVENAVWHGLMHKKEKGQIGIFFCRQDNILKCTIEDNGIGRQRSYEIKKEQHPEHRSAGMSLTRERLDILNNITTSNMNVIVTDLVNEEGKALGTRVELTIREG